MKKPFSFLVLSFLLLYSCAQAQQNIILIIADDVSPDYFGSFSTTTDTAIAPNIRALGDQGIRFTKLWGAPVCSPVRAGIFTGRYPFRTGVGEVITNMASPQLDTSEVSIAELLKYHAPSTFNAGSAGKWHLHAASPQQRIFPNTMGYDFYSGNFSGALTNFYSYQRITNGLLDTVTNYATTQTVNDAISWMDTMNTSKPFFLWLAFNAPHSPYHIPPATLCDTTGLIGTTADINANPEKYFKAAIQAMDTEMGRLFQYLTSHNLMDSTNIIFIGDNGNDSKVAQIANTTKAKATLYHYGVNVPMIVKGPAVVNPNRNSDALINTPDLFATISELGGLMNWKSFIPTSTVVDSKSFLPIIRNQLLSTRNWIFTEQFKSTPAASDGKTIRNENYHLIRLDNGTEQFYNQSIDIEENVNLLSGTMNAVDILNYHFLCDTLTALVGGGICQPLMLHDIHESEEISLFPNPSSNYVEVRCLQNIAYIKLFDAMGKQVFYSTQKTFALPSLAKGLYIVEIQLMNSTRMYKKLFISY
ncbi:MAG: sulfatase-like hydrolase/transferase [Bacteroidetes bacterium]|nr:sulfatase-like hydrolase/transferase [Bacteroidota bacterium]